MLIIDGHCDTILDIVNKKRRLGEKSNIGHVDLPRLREAGVNVQFFALFVESIFKPHNSLLRVMQMIDTLYEEAELNAKYLNVVTTQRELKQNIEKNEQVAAIISIEGGEALEGDIGVLKCLFKLGVRSLGLTWNQRNALADGVGEGDNAGGLSSFGKQVVREMNDLGIIVDLAHIAEKGFWDVLDITTKPVLVSHANCKSVWNHRRNITDKQIKALAAIEGVVGVTFVPDFVGEKPSIVKLVEHIDHICQVVGNANHVGIGSDFDGTESIVEGLEDVTKLQNLIKALEHHGFSAEDISKIMGKNMLRVLMANLPV
ncbi:dipeptidase [Bacillota bacterium LX-D]|nr:dipeptidase [Bacillota bacterium LX-D]